MSMVWIAVLMLGAPASDVGTASAASSSQGLPATTKAQQAAAPLRTGRALGEAVHAALVRWAHADEKTAASAAREFLVLYKELQADTRLPAPDRRELQAKVRGRLVRLSPMIARVAARRQGAARQQPATVATVGGPPAVLAQQAPAGGGGAALPGGGPNGNGPDADDGWKLVDLIQTTIAPETWDVNGGLGSIYYWRNQHALVIRATDDVHGFVGEVIDQLQRAGN
jgi:hypothetical protein